MNGRLLSKRGNRMHRFETLLGSLSANCVLDGEIVALDAAGPCSLTSCSDGGRRSS
jgi:ATP-dependent DNA ligase